MTKKVLVTGANGFVGSHIVDTLLRRGYDVRAMVRKSSNLEWLERKDVELVYGTLDDREAMNLAVKGANAVIHNAGVIASQERYHYYKANSEGTRLLLEAVIENAPDISRFVYVSSQAAGGPTPTPGLRTEAQESEPVTHYGRSKLVAEGHLAKFDDQLPITIIRPPSIYGPRDIAFLTMFKMIADGWQPIIGDQRELSLTHVQDLARQIVLQMEHEDAIGEMFYSAPFDPITFEELGDLIAKVLGATPRKIRIPDAVIRYGYPAVFPILKILGIKPPFNNDKLPEILGERWTISGDKAKEMLGFEGQMPTLAGLGQTTEWYRWKKWLKSPRDKMKERGGIKVQMRSLDGKRKPYDCSCDLCALVFDGEIKTKKHYEDDDFIIVDCLICRVPMAVLKEHRASFTEEEKNRLLKIFKEQFGEVNHPDFEQRRIPEHAHVHCRNEPHLLPWQKRPE